MRVQRAVDGRGAIMHTPAARATPRVTESIVSLRAHECAGGFRTYPEVDVRKSEVLEISAVGGALRERNLRLLSHTSARRDDWAWRERISVEDLML